MTERLRRSLAVPVKRSRSGGSRRTVTRIGQGGVSGPRGTDGPTRYFLEGFRPTAKPRHARTRAARSVSLASASGWFSATNLENSGVASRSKSWTWPESQDWRTLLSAAVTGWPDSRAFAPSFQAAAYARLSSGRYYPGNKEGHIPTRSASEGPMKSSESRRGSPLDD